jgi:hypothetical protein
MDNYTLRWYDEEQTIILIDIVKTWTWEDAYAAIKQQVAMTESVAHPVHAIFHFHNVPAVPRKFGLTHIAKLMKTRAPNEELAVFVGTHALLQMLINALSNVYGMGEITAKYHFVATLDEALDIIARYDSENP